MLQSGLTLLSVEEPDAKVVYVYARGSPFEESINRYMSSYEQGLYPYDPNAIFVDSTSVNSSMTEMGTTSPLKPYVIEKKPQIA